MEHKQAVAIKLQSTCTVSSYQVTHSDNPRLAESRRPAIKITSPAMHESESTDSGPRKCHDDLQTSQQQISCVIEPQIEPDTPATTEPNNGSSASTKRTDNHVQHTDAGGHDSGAKQIEAAASSTASSLGVEATSRFRALDRCQLRCGSDSNLT